MFIYKKTYWLIAAMLPVLFSGCYKDLGNYSYHPINSITVKLASSYAAYFGENLSIKPEIEMTMDEDSYDTSRYSYEWSTIDNTQNFDDQRKVLAKTRDLDAPMVSPPGGNYQLFFRITDKTTGVMAEAVSKITIVTHIYEGWLALCDVNGHSRLDMESIPQGAQGPGDYVMIPDVLTAVGSTLPMAAKPVSVSFFKQVPWAKTAASMGISIATESGTNRIDPELFTWVDSTMNIRKDFLSPISSSFVAQSFTPCGQEICYLRSAAGDVYYYYRTGQTYFGPNINYVKGEAAPFPAAPYVAAASFNSIVTYVANTILYDTKGKRFVSHKTGSNLSCVALADPANKLFSYTTGMDLTYMEFAAGGPTTNGGNVYAVLHDAPSGKSFLAVMQAMLGTGITQTYYDSIPLSTATDFDKAEHFAVSPDLGYLFYSVGGKVYEYDRGLRKSFLMIDRPDRPVTVLKFQHFCSGAYTTLYTKLVVASYDGSNTSGSGAIDLYNVIQANSQITPYQSFTGFGKIKDLTYRER